jgi:hypothetical protein
MTEDMRNLQLPRELCERVEQRFGQQFGKVEDFLIYVMERLVRYDAKAMDQEEQRIIEERLKDLGYI